MADYGPHVQIDRRILFPGVTVANLNEEGAQCLFLEEHKSRNTLHNVIFTVKLDVDIGHQDIHDKKRKKHGTLRTCMDAYRLMDNDEEYRKTVLLA